MKQIFRVYWPKQPESHYTCIPNKLWDMPLSSQAVRIAAFLMSQRPGWKFSAFQIHTRMRVRFDRVGHYLEELERSQILAKRVDGSLKLVYEIRPVSDWILPQTDHVIRIEEPSADPDHVISSKLITRSGRSRSRDQVTRITRTKTRPGTPNPKGPLDGGPRVRDPAPRKKRPPTEAELLAEVVARVEREASAVRQPMLRAVPSPPPRGSPFVPLAGLTRALEPILSDDQREARRDELLAQLLEMGVRDDEE